ncbi:hypothetical protein [Actinomyces sp. oral taxon 897]|uniref:hypothetical protein n=1 Tax=Actinomyces sp. oral taxon 897 TaxID=2081702 RepID=UPI00101AE335|nr:hypothetical protein [Actinomyces sp. oral taxon 897]
MPGRTQRQYRLRRDTMFSESAGGIYFSNSTSGFEIRGANAYRVFRSVYPLLEGGHTEESLREILGQEAWRRLQVFIEPLRAHGYLRLVDPCDDIVLDDGVETRFADQINFLAHYTDEPRRAFVAFRDARLTVLGEGACAVALARALADNGASVIRVIAPGSSDDAVLGDVPDQAVVVRADPRTDHEVLTGTDVLVLTPCSASSDLLLHGVDEDAGRKVLPIWAIGDEIVIGPAGWTGSEPLPRRWADAVQSFTDHCPDGAAARFWSRSWAGLPTGAESTWNPALERMAGVIAAFEVFKAVTGAMDPETVAHVLVLNCLSGETRRHRVLPSRCLRLMDDTPERLGAMRRAAEALLDHPMRTPERTSTSDLAVYDALVGSRTLPVRRFTDEDLDQLPLKVSTAEVVEGPGEILSIGGADLWNVAGARQRAVRQALALYLEHWAPARRSRAQGPEVTSLSGQLSKAPGPLPDLVPAQEVATGAPRAVPAAATATLSPANGAGLFARGCAGTGIGAGTEDAVESALRSAAVGTALRAAATDRPGLLLTDWGRDERTAFLLRTATDVGVEPEVIDLGTWLGRRVVAVRASLNGRTLWEVQAGALLEEAVIEALVGVLGAVQRGDMTTWTQLAHPSYPPEVVAVVHDDVDGPDPKEPCYGAVLVCDVTSPEVDGAGLVACKVLVCDPAAEAGA